MINPANPIYSLNSLPEEQEDLSNRVDDVIGEIARSTLLTFPSLSSSKYDLNSFQKTVTVDSSSSPHIQQNTQYPIGVKTVYKPPCIVKEEQYSPIEKLPKEYEFHPYFLALSPMDQTSLRKTFLTEYKESLNTVFSKAKEEAKELFKTLLEQPTESSISFLAIDTIYRNCFIYFQIACKPPNGSRCCATIQSLLKEISAKDHRKTRLILSKIQAIQDRFNNTVREAWLSERSTSETMIGRLG